MAMDDRVHQHLIKAGDLECLTKPSQKSSMENQTGIMLLHGYGADAFDLYPLAEALDPGGCYNWFFPQAPLPLENRPGQAGRAWFPLEERYLQQSLTGGVDWSQWNSPAVTQASSALLTTLKALMGRYERFYLGGFSQGSMVVLDTVLEFDLAPTGVCLLSSTLLKKDRWIQLLGEKSQQLRYFQSHGTEDPLLPCRLAEKLNQCLSAAGWEGEFYKFPGGHQIPGLLLARLSLWLADASHIETRYAQKV